MTSRRGQASAALTRRQQPSRGGHGLPDTGHIGFELAEQVAGRRMERRLVDAGQALLLGLQDRSGGAVVEQSADVQQGSSVVSRM